MEDDSVRIPETTLRRYWLSNYLSLEVCTLITADLTQKMAKLNQTLESILQAEGDASMVMKAMVLLLLLF